MPEPLHVFVGGDERLDHIETHLLQLARSAEEDENPAQAKLLREEAEPYVRRTIEVSEKLVRLQPDDAVNGRILKSAKANAARYLFESGRFEEAGRVLSAAVADFAEFARSDPDNQEQKLDLAVIVSWEGACHSPHYGYGFGLIPADGVVAHMRSQ